MTYCGGAIGSIRKCLSLRRAVLPAIIQIGTVLGPQAENAELPIRDVQQPDM